MNKELPNPVPEIPVKNLSGAMAYYEKRLGFHCDWGKEGGGIGQVSRGRCRLFLTDHAFRAQNGSPNPPVVIWLNLNSRSEVDELHAEWSSNGADIFGKPEPKPWHLHEFTAADLDGNLLRVFYDFAWELPDRGGRAD
jgi:predicted lactoylglutathione lyase